MIWHVNDCQIGNHLWEAVGVGEAEVKKMVGEVVVFAMKLEGAVVAEVAEALQGVEEEVSLSFFCIFICTFCQNCPKYKYMNLLTQMYIYIVLVGGGGRGFG